MIFTDIVNLEGNGSEAIKSLLLYITQVETSEAITNSFTIKLL